jgi:hypothetical protein
MLALWKKETNQTLTHMQTVVFVGRMFWYSMILIVTGWDPEGETKSLRIVSAALGYTIPEMGKTVLLIVHQSIFGPTLHYTVYLIRFNRLIMRIEI